MIYLYAGVTKLQFLGGIQFPQNNFPGSRFPSQSLVTFFQFISQFHPEEQNNDFKREELQLFHELLFNFGFFVQNADVCICI